MRAHTFVPVVVPVVPVVPVVSVVVAAAAVAVAIVLSSAIAHARTIRVPAQSPSLRTAVAEAAHFDTILVAPGTYTGVANREITFDGRVLRIVSEMGPEATVIDAEGQGRCFHLSDEDPDGSVIQGFTLTGGASSHGGALLAEGVLLTVRDCWIFDNRAAYGGGVSIEGGEVRLEDCWIAGNHATEADGGGLYVERGEVTLVRCAVTGNLAAQGGALRLHRSSSASLTATTLAGNRATTEGGAVYLSFSSNVTVSGLILRGNCARVWPDLALGSACQASLACVFLDRALTGGAGSIAVEGAIDARDPLLCGPAPCEDAPTTRGNFGIATASPALGVEGCAPVIGALGVACDAVPVEPRSWGNVKLRYR